MVTTQMSDPMLTAFLAQGDQPCPQCGYNLRHLTGNRCPECGEELVLRVNLAEPKQRLLLGGLIGLASGAGFNGLLIIYACLLEFQRQYGAGGKFWRLILGGFVIIGGMLGLWLYKWRRLRRLSKTIRIFLLLCCWLVSLVDIVIFTIYIG